MPKVIAMIPARLGSQRLKQKNLLEIDGEPLIVRAMNKAKAMDCFDEIWVNSEADVFGDLARANGVSFHKRPTHLGDKNATSEEFVNEFLEAHPCDYLVQLHSIAPLVTPDEIRRFVIHLTTTNSDTLLAGVHEQIQCMMGGKALNFSRDGMNATQELVPIDRISWSLTGWRAQTYLDTFKKGGCATFHGTLDFFGLSRASGIVIKYDEDYQMVKALAAAGFGK
jgi:CMP-N-acetylneuraminic acid synthetase